MNDVEIRRVEERDVGALWEMMRQLSVFERRPFLLTEEDLRKWLFDPSSLFRVHVAETRTEGKTGLVGYAATYRLVYMDDLRPTLVLKGLYVDPAHRAKGIARRLMRAFAADAFELGCGRAHWFALVSNERAASFYAATGATPDQDWTRWRLDLARLRKLADGSED
jgi:GNAT superfamily N-acetyltransferase